MHERGTIELLLSMHACSKITRVLKQAIRKMLQLVEPLVDGVFILLIKICLWGCGCRYNLLTSGFWWTTKW